MVWDSRIWCRSFCNVVIFCRTTKDKRRKTKGYREWASLTLRRLTTKDKGRKTKGYREWASLVLRGLTTKDKRQKAGYRPPFALRHLSLVRRSLRSSSYRPTHYSLLKAYYQKDIQQTNRVLFLTI